MNSINNGPLTKRVRNGWALFIILAATHSTPALSATTVIQPDEANVTLENDGFLSAKTQNRATQTTVGDFNGDGADDVALLFQASTATFAVELFLAPFEQNSLFSARSKTTIRCESSGDPIELPASRMTDLNNDGKKDLVLSRTDSSANRKRVEVLFGRTAPPATINLDESVPDLQIRGAVGADLGTDAESGDFDGNGAGDLAILTRGSTSTITFVLGETGLPSKTVDVESDESLPHFSTSTFISRFAVGDFNGDGKDDLAYSSYDESLPNAHTTPNILFGRAPFSPTGSDVLIEGYYWELGGGQYFLDPVAEGDLTGDHKDELFVQGLDFNDRIFVIDGADLSSGRSTLNQQTGLPGTVPFVAVPFDGFSFNWKVVSADFDGDGADDVFSIRDAAASGYLTSAIHPGGMALTQWGTASLGWVGRFSLGTSGDFNGDGFQDILTYEDFNSIYSPYGAIRILYGYRPLDHPTLQVASGPGDGLRVSLALSVEGNPTEMRFSGDVSEDLANQWIPYAPLKDVKLTPEGLTKTVSVRFRNAVERESDTVSTTVTLHVDNERIETDTNRLRPGGSVKFEYHVTNAGPLRAGVYGPQGTQVRRFEDRTVFPGICEIAWDGKNDFGNRVARGVYFLRIETDGINSKKDILVE